MALHFGYKVDMTIFPKHVSVAVTGLDNDDYALYTSAIDSVSVSCHCMMPCQRWIK